MVAPDGPSDVSISISISSDDGALDPATPGGAGTDALSTDDGVAALAVVGGLTPAGAG